MEYAVIKSGGKQYRVAAGDRITVDSVTAEPASELTIADVLLVVDGDNVLVGTPVVEGAKVTALVVDHKKGNKIRVSKFKSKVRYRKTTGFRASLTTLEIQSIEAKGVKFVKPVVKESPKKEVKTETKEATVAAQKVEKKAVTKKATGKKTAIKREVKS